jgi:hypothetical protein
MSVTCQWRASCVSLASSRCIGWLAFFAISGVVPAEEPPRLPKYGPEAARLFHAREYVRAHEAPDFWALTPYYVSQPDQRSCSAASVAMLINALRADRDLKADEPLATPAAIVDVVDGRLGKNKLAPEGEGVTLDELATIVRHVLPSYRLTPTRIETVRFLENAENAAEAKSRLRQLLIENERSARDMVLVNFLQSVITGDPEGAVGHIAPVAAYDAREGRVLLFDPDRQWYEPYWVSDDTLLKAMATRDSVSGQVRGLLYVTLE